MAEGHHLGVFDGSIRTRLQSGTDFTTNIGIPTGVTLLNYRPRFARYRRATIIVGRHSPGSIYRDDINNAWRLGIPKPAAAPTNATQGVGVTGNIITYYAYEHWETGGTLLIHRGNLSPASATIALANQGVRVTVPGTAPITRVNYIGVFISVDGDIPKLTGRVALGTTTFDWNGPVSGRGETIPVNADGTINVDGRGEPPDATIVLAHGERVFYNSRTYPERWYYSLLEEPESVGPLAFFPTKDREAIVGAGSQDDQCIIFCAECGYDLQGFSAGGSTPDFKMRKIFHTTGAISHDSIAKVYGKLHWAAKDGPYRNPGGGAEAQPLADRLFSAFWKTDYAARRIAYEDSIADFDREHEGYKLLIPGAPAFAFIGSYAGESMSETLPEWYFFDRARFDNYIGTLWDANSAKSVHYTGGPDGILRKENQDVNDDDDGDAAQKTVKLSPKHLYFPDQFGDRFHGATVVVVQLYMKCSQSFRVSIYAGDDSSSEGLPQWGPYTFPTLDLTGAGPETSKTIKPRVGGQGMSLLLEVPLARNFEWRGFTVVGGEGVRARTRSR